MNWKIKAALQKILSQSRIGDRINHMYGSLQKNYHEKGVEYGYRELLLKLRLIETEKEGGVTWDNALEIGTGYFLVQPIILKLLGWKRIVTVDISRDVFDTAAQKQLRILLQDKYLSGIRELSTLDHNQFEDFLNTLKVSRSLGQILKTCNITYIAPYEFDTIDSTGLTFDFIFSQVVMEHIPPPVLEELFFRSKQWLAKDGYIVHVINFTDHFANPGFFGDNNISEFNFLRYSDKYWKFWAGNPIAYVNRLGYPYYYQLCARNRLSVVRFIEQNYKEKKPFKTNMIHPDVLLKYDNNIRQDDLLKVQRGMFLITHLRSGDLL